MLRKTILTLAAVAAVGLAIPTMALARGGGGGGGHGGGFGGPARIGPDHDDGPACRGGDADAVGRVPLHDVHRARERAGVVHSGSARLRAEKITAKKTQREGVKR